METHQMTLRFPLGQDQIVFEEAPNKRGAGTPWGPVNLLGVRYE